MSVAFVFPGQGADHGGFLHCLPEHAEVDRTLDEARALLGIDPRAIDCVAAIHKEADVQRVLVIAGVAVARALVAEAVRPGVVAGMSIGAFSAAVACEALAFGDALRIARLRGELMEAAFPRGYGLAVIEGLDEDHVQCIVTAVRKPALPVYVSNVNAPRQLVIAGSDCAIHDATRRARQEGATRTERLVIDVPSHVPLMQPIADRLVRAMASLPMKTPSVPYIGNRRGRALYDAEAIREDLATNVAHTVRWSDSLEVMRELGASVFVEMPPGHVSTRLVRSLMNDVTAVAVDDDGLRRAIVVAHGADTTS